MRGVLVGDHFSLQPKFVAEVAPLVASGDLKYSENHRRRASGTCRRPSSTCSAEPTPANAHPRRRLTSLSDIPQGRFLCVSCAGKWPWGVFSGN